MYYVTVVYPIYGHMTSYLGEVLQALEGYIGPMTQDAEVGDGRSGESIDGVSCRGRWSDR